MAIIPGRITRNGEQHLGDGGDERRAARGIHRVGGHRALHHEEIRAPVTERRTKPSPIDHAEPLDAHRVGRGTSQVLPRLGPRAGHSPARRDRRQLRRQACQPPTSFRPSSDQRQEPEHDQEELQHLVVDRAGQPAEEDIDSTTTAETTMLAWMFQPSSSCSSAPIAYMLMPDENTVMTAKVMALKPRVFSSKRSFRYSGTDRGARAVIERHHEHADEHHRRDRAHPVEVAGHDAVLGAAGRHADHFLRAEVGGEERQPGDPRGDRAAGEEEVGAARRSPAQREPDPSTNAA